MTREERIEKIVSMTTDDAEQYDIFTGIEDGYCCYKTIPTEIYNLVTAEIDEKTRDDYAEQIGMGCAVLHEYEIGFSEYIKLCLNKWGTDELLDKIDKLVEDYLIEYNKINKNGKKDYRW